MKTITFLFLISISSFAFNSHFPNNDRGVNLKENLVELIDMKEKNFIECRALGYSFQECDNLGAGFSDCLRTGRGFDQCRLAQAGFLDCENDRLVFNNQCLNAQSGYLDCRNRREGIAAINCLRADYSYGNCRESRNYRNDHDFCLNPLSEESLIVSPRESNSFSRRY